MNPDIHAALFVATPERVTSSASESVGVAWWGSSPVGKELCHCCKEYLPVYKGYNGGAHMPARFCRTCKVSGHERCSR